ncbi:DUF4440 domain-containing protein [Phycicoccus mangrovi]|uniref:DUF4440 domain-containing protein n=1 Tax=Phycicoccus mangrovi TaxID=2840470 RepID=UPI003557C424
MTVRTLLHRDRVTPILTAHSPDQLVDFLIAALGFRPSPIERDGAVAFAHARLEWSDGGAVMVVPATCDGPSLHPPGTAQVYLHTPVVTAVLARARQAGVDLVSDLRVVGPSGQEFVVRDPEGNLWLVGSAASQPADDPTATSEDNEPERTRDEVGLFMTAWAEAIVSNDVERIAHFTTPDWILVDRPGVISRQAFHTAVASGALQHTSMSHDVLSIRAIGQTLVVVTHGRNIATFRGEQIEADEWTTDVLVRDGDQWRCAFTQLTPRPQQGQS